MLNRYAGSDQLCERFSLSVGNKHRVGAVNKGSLLVVVFLDRAEDFIAQTQIDGQALSGFPIVLREARIDLPAVVNVVQARNRTTIGNSQQHRGEGTAAGSRCRRVVGEVVAKFQT